LVGSGQGFGMGSFPGKIDKAPQPGKRLFRFVCVPCRARDELVFVLH
jgi:hypothetical protein